MGGSLPGTGPDLFRRKAELLIASSEFLELCDTNFSELSVGFGQPDSPLFGDCMPNEDKVTTCHNFFSQCPDLAA